VARGFDSVHFVDTVASFGRALDAGISEEQLFSDFQHPSLLGHAIIAHNFLLQISELEPLDQLPDLEPTLEFQSTSLRSLVPFYKQMLGVSDGKSAKVLVTSAMWHLFLAQNSAYPEDYLAVAEDKIRQYFERTPRTPPDQALMLLFLAWAEAIRGDHAQALDLANEAAGYAPKVVDDFLYGAVYSSIDGVYLTGERVNIFNRLGLTYDDDRKKFVLATPLGEERSK
jgi:hypothetical protein